MKRTPQRRRRLILVLPAVIAMLLLPAAASAAPSPASSVGRFSALNAAHAVLAIAAQLIADGVAMSLRRHRFERRHNWPSASCRMLNGLASSAAGLGMTR